MKTYKLTLIGIVALFATGCSSDADEGQNGPKSRMEMNAEEEGISEAEIESAFAIFEDMADATTSDRENIVYSPLSKDLCLGMVANALADNDRDRIVRKMGASSATALNEFNKSRLNYFSYNNKKAKVFFANSIWANSRWMTSEQEFGTSASVIKQYYDAECRILDFGSADIQKQIKEWCSDKTNGVINDFKVSAPSVDAVKSIIINTLFFDCQWKEPFTKGSAKSGDFYKANGTERVCGVNMMQAQRVLAAEWTESFAAFEMPYADCNYSAVFVLPDKGKTFRDILPDVKKMLLSRTLDNKEASKCEISMPRFTTAHEYDLTELVSNTGINFNNCVLSGFDNDMVSVIKQAVNLSVTETGTKIATKTEWTGMVSALPGTPIHLDRPFLMIVKDNNHGSILLMAAIQMPKE